MTGWPSADGEGRHALWAVHNALVDLRAAARRGDRPDAVLDGASLLADAIDELLTRGPAGFRSTVSAPPGLHLIPGASRAAHAGPEAASGSESRAFAGAVRDVLRELCRRSPRASMTEWEAVFDSLEYLPCDLLRTGAAALDGLDDPREPEHTRSLAEHYRTLLDP